ncbi:hypothetical protein [Mycobacterium sp. 852002-51971_SCH5477799-a]|uniref:hypothetical protein n=1 Tax=Mycobacterium sp. 852002-51971_SCH5477799-a TaxID=1834106 RepID=UPI0012E92665|nr:hypothetical protein [Mycobacterium sp. 852002-51971_SCH5477799-a]
MAATAVAIGGLGLAGLGVATEAQAHPGPFPQWCPGEWWDPGWGNNWDWNNCHDWRHEGWGPGNPDWDRDHPGGQWGPGGPGQWGPGGPGQWGPGGPGQWGPGGPPPPGWHP